MLQTLVRLIVAALLVGLLALWLVRLKDTSRICRAQTLLHIHDAQRQLTISKCEPLYHQLDAEFQHVCDRHILAAHANVQLESVWCALGEEFPVVFDEERRALALAWCSTMIGQLTVCLVALASVLGLYVCACGRRHRPHHSGRHALLHDQLSHGCTHPTLSTLPLCNQSTGLTAADHTLISIPPWKKVA